jgi:hypothetical protein
MALTALRSYGGRRVALVSEWDGDTGTPAFTAELLRGWRLLEALPLPNWTDTAHDLTIWERRAEVEGLDDAAAARAAAWPRCCHSGAVQLFPV